MIKRLGLCSIACLSTAWINPYTQIKNEQSSLHILSTAALYGGAITAVGAIPVTAATVLLGNKDHGILNIEPTNASTAVLVALASPGVCMLLECFFRPKDRESATNAKEYLKRAAAISLGIATTYGASKLTNNTIAPSTFVASFFTGLTMITALTIHSQTIRPSR
jgi:hypothetical protein